MDPFSEQMLLNHNACAQNLASWNSPPDPPDPPDPPEMQSSGAGHTLGSTRAGGQDDGSWHKLPQTTWCNIRQPMLYFAIQFGALDFWIFGTLWQPVATFWTEVRDPLWQPVATRDNLVAKRRENLCSSNLSDVKTLQTFDFLILYFLFCKSALAFSLTRVRGFQWMYATFTNL